MNMKYEIPLEGLQDHFTVGEWVEIFEAYADDEKSIQVRSMRVGGNVLMFPRRNRRKKPSSRALKPHEGEIVSIDRGPVVMSFAIRLRA